MRATSSKAALMTSCGASARMLTMVPSHGCARSVTSFCKDDRIGCQQPLDSVGNMPGRQRGPGDVANVSAQLELRVRPFANELPPPLRIANLSTVGLAVFKNLHVLHVAFVIQPEGKRNVLMLAYDFVHNEPSTCRDAPNLELLVADRHA